MKMSSSPSTTTTNGGGAAASAGAGAALAVPNSGNSSTSSVASSASSVPVALVMKKSMDDLLAGSQEVIATVIQRSPSPVRKRLTTPAATTTATASAVAAATTAASDFSCPVGLEVTEASPISTSPLDRQFFELVRSPSSTDERIFPSPNSEKEPSEYGDIGVPHSTKKEKHKLKLGQKAKKKAWYSVLYPSYKARTEEFKKLFKEVPDDDRLIGDYSCAIQKDILVHGRLYVSQSYICFHANLLVYETKLVLKMRDVTSIVKDKTARVIPNAISVYTENEKHFFTSFASRDKTYLILFRVWQNALMDTPMNPQELWQQVHRCYGDELGLTTDDEDYIDPTDEKKPADAKLSAADSGSGDLISDVTGNSSSKDKSSGSSGPGQLSSGVKVRKPTTLKLNQLAKKQTMMIGVKRSELSPVEPTDMSDTSDSDTGTNIETSTYELVECDSKHEGRQLVHTILPINVETLFGLLFSKSKFFSDFHDSRRSQNLDLGDWQVNAESSIKERQVKLTVAINQSVGPKNSHITELQTLRPCSKDSLLYAVDIESTNAGIPYADSFSVMLHYCMQRTQDDHTVLSVHAHIHYKKSVWGFVKGFIEKNTWAGLEEFFQALLKALQSEYCIPPAKTKARKNRRGNGLASTRGGSLSESPALHHTAHANLKDPSTTRPYDIPAVLAGEKLRHERLFSWIVMAMLFALVVINIFLYYKLWGLEEIADTVDASDYIIKYTTENGMPPESHSDWVSLLQQQEIYHAKEVQQWHTMLQTSVEQLRKIEATLAEIQKLMHVKKGGGLGGGVSD